MFKTTRLLALFALATAVCLAPTMASGAATTTWTGTNGTDWFDAGNWNNGIPTQGAGNIANISLLNANAVINSATPAVAQQLNLGTSGANNVTLDIQSDLATLELGNWYGNGTVVNMSAGNWTHGNGYYWARDTGDNVTFNMTGGTAQFNSNATLRMCNTGNTQMTWNISGGALVLKGTAQTVAVTICAGAGLNQSGSINVTGAATAVQFGTTTLGAATINDVSNKASFNFTDSTVVLGITKVGDSSYGEMIGLNGMLTLGGASSVGANSAAGKLDLAGVKFSSTGGTFTVGSASNAAGTGTVLITSGSTNMAAVNVNRGSMTVKGPAIMGATAINGGTFAFDSTRLTTGTFKVGTASLVGTGSVVGSDWVTMGTTTLVNGSSLDVTTPWLTMGVLTVGDSTSAATVLITSGSAKIAGPSYVSHGTLTIDAGTGGKTFVGGGSVQTVFVGNAGPATLNLNNVTWVSGLMTVGSNGYTGKVIMNGGTWSNQFAIGLGNPSIGSPSFGNLELNGASYVSGGATTLSVNNGSVKQVGGVYKDGAGNAAIINVGGINGNAIYALSGGGVVDITSNAGGTMRVGGTTNAVGKFSIAGSSTLVASSVLLGAWDNTSPTNVGTGTFEIEGSLATINLLRTSGSVANPMAVPSYYQGAGSMLKLLVDSTATGISPIVGVDGNNSTHLYTVYFDTGSLLDVGFMDGVTDPTTTMTYTVMDLSAFAYSQITFNDLSFAPSVDTTVWSMDADAELQKLTVTYTPIPEPATLALLAIGGATMLLRRRRG